MHRDGAALAVAADDRSARDRSAGVAHPAVTFDPQDAPAPSTDFRARSGSRPARLGATLKPPGYVHGQQ